MNHERTEKDFFEDKLIALLRAKMSRETPGFMQRDAHPKQHGLVKAQFKVVDNLPPHLQHGVFVPGRRYKAWVEWH